MKFELCEKAGLDTFMCDHNTWVVHAHTIERYLESLQPKPSPHQLQTSQEDGVEFFKPGDFRVPDRPMADYCNRLLEERGTVVYGMKSISRDVWTFDEQPGEFDTHTALLINIQPIAKTDTAESLLRDLAQMPDDQLVPLNKFAELCDRAKKILAEKKD